MIRPGLKGFSVLLISVAVFIIRCSDNYSTQYQSENKPHNPSSKKVWESPGLSTIPNTEDGLLIQYGRELISNTSYYLGPKGTVAHITNGMNCQNCHLEAGTKAWGNNYSAVNSTYPKFRDRSGTVENIFKRVNDCIERSLNGRPLDSTSREMKAIIAYVKWLGKEVPKGVRPIGTGIEDIAVLNRPANPVKGELVYIKNCQQCHSYNGQGKKTLDSIIYIYPPLWGEHSYNVGAGLYRISRLAGYVKNNMPYGVTYLNPQLTNEEAWDVAAFVNSQPRPGINLSKDWPDISTKPFDYPFAPYADGFSAIQHKYGSFIPIKKAIEEVKKQKNQPIK